VTQRRAGGSCGPTGASRLSSREPGQSRPKPRGGHCHGKGLAARWETDNSEGMKPPPDPHYRHRFPAEIISHAVWLYHVFSLSLRDVELLLAERGIVVSYETVRRWCRKFGQSFANCLRHRRPRPGDKWYLDEGYCQFNSRPPPCSQLSPVQRWPHVLILHCQLRA
jgi:putative transposase